MSSDASDLELVTAARAGDRDAMEMLLRRHHDRLAQLCRRIVHDAEDAADCTQDALIAIVRGLDGFDGRAAFTTWTHRIATNACLDHLRRRTRRPLTEPMETEPASDVELPAGRAGTRGTPAAGVEQVAGRLDVDAALAALPVEFRVPVVLRDLYGMDYAEIAEICDLPPGTVRSRISRGRRALAPLLDPGNQTEPSGVGLDAHD